MGVDSPAPIPKVLHADENAFGSHDVDGSQFSGSQFSEQNPLTHKDPSSFVTSGEAKKPQAVALHGWQRTVGVDEDFISSPTFPVCLGAPGTGLSKTKVPPNGGAVLGPGLGRRRSRESSPSPAVFGAVSDAQGTWEALRVTREDKKEAKSLRALPVAAGAAPLPFPRVVSETDDSSASSEAESLDSTSRRRKERQLETQSSTASSDLSFLVNTVPGNAFGTRPTFGRAIEPRIPATVGEERLQHSLAKYFGQRREVQGGDSAGESRTSSASRERERSVRGSVSSTPVAKAETVESSSNDSPGKVTRSSGSGNGSGSSDCATAGVAAQRVDRKNFRLGADADAGAAQQGAGRGGGGGEGGRRDTARKAPKEASGTAVRAATAKKFSSAASTDKSTSLEDSSCEGGRRLAKPTSDNGERVEPGQKVSLCGCLRSWPWKVLAGLVMLVSLVSVAVVVNVGGSSNGRRRLRPLPDPTTTAAVPPGDASASALRHSRPTSLLTGEPRDGSKDTGLRARPGVEGGATWRRSRERSLRARTLDVEMVG